MYHIPRYVENKYDAGLFKGFTGIDQEYEKPSSPELVLKAGELSIMECVQQVVQKLIEEVRAVRVCNYVKLS